MTKKLKPCPLCGGEAKKVVFGLEGYKTIGCKKCGVLMPLYRTLKETIEAWNNRPSPWHTGTPTEEGDYLLALRFENLKLDVAHFKDGVFRSYHDHIIASSYIRLWQKIEEVEETK